MMACNVSDSQILLQCESTFFPYQILNNKAKKLFPNRFTSQSKLSDELERTAPSKAAVTGLENVEVFVNKLMASISLKIQRVHVWLHH